MVLNESPAGAPALPADLLRIQDEARVVRSSFADGRTMTWRIWGKGHPIVLLHGAFGDWMHWSRNIPALMERHTVVVPDMPGAGDSDLSDARTMDVLGTLVASGLDEIGVTGEFDLVGFSLGSTVSLHFPATYWPRVRRLAIVGAAAIGPHKRVQTLESWRKIADPAERARVYASNLRALMVANDATIDAATIAIYAHGVEAWRIQLRGLSRTGESAERLAKWRPARFDAIWGAEDIVVRDTLDVLGDIVRRAAPGASCHHIQGAGHWVQYEGSAAVNKILLAS